MRQGDFLRQTLPRLLLAGVERKVKQHRETMLSIPSQAEWERRRNNVERAILQAIGGYPDDTPLNARTIAMHERDGYRIENILVDSLPGFELNINLYVPSEIAAPAPAVLCPTGHSGKESPHYQELAQGICRMGCVALIYDCLGRGERSAGNEHFDVGTQCVMLGRNLLRYFVWDSRRALDFLLTRPEVDPGRIGCTGTSGGGRTTIFHTALDPRIACAVPLCCQLSVLEQVRQRYTGCPEAYLWGFLGSGYDIPDVLAMAAPRPLQIIAATRDDINSVDIAESTFDIVRHIYSLYGAEQKVSLELVDDPHGYTKAMRRRMYDWMCRWLRHEPPRLDEPPQPDEPPLVLEQPEVLACPLSGETTVATLNAAAVREVERKRRPCADYAERVRHVLALPARRRPGEVVGRETTPLFGYPRIEEYLVRSEKGVVLPAARLVPAEDGHNVLYLAETGCESYYMNAITEEFRQTQLPVITADCRGIGSLRPWPSPWEHVWFCQSEWEMTQGLWELGRTLVGMRVTDLQAVLDAVLPAGGKVIVVATARLGLTAAHLAVLDGRASAMCLIDSLGSLADLAAAPRNRWGYSSALPSVLLHYDVPDLLASLAPRPLMVLNARTAGCDPLSDEDAQRTFHRVYQAYASNLDDLRIETGVPAEKSQKMIIDWATAVVARA